MTDPQTLGTYRVICPLGEGGMARVYLCSSKGIGGFRKLLVVKALRSDFASDSEFLEMFLDEARIAGRLNHPNVVQTNEVGIADGTHFIAMEYLEGQPLSAVIKRVSRKGMPLHLHLRILSDALLGLHYAHELADFDGTKLNVVHRDVSPQNIFVTYDGATKVVDFGIAKAAGSAALTREGVLKGKVAYMAPEQAAMESVDRRADIFAVGVMLWEALAKRRLVPNGSDDLAALNRRISGKEPKVYDVVPSAPPELVEICQKAMGRLPQERYETALQMREDIEAYIVDTSRAGDDVAKLMTEHFAKDRADLRALIDAQLQHPSMDGSDDLAAKSGFKRASEISDLSEASARSIKRDTNPPRRMATNLAITAAALVVGAVVAFGWIRAKGGDSSSVPVEPKPAAAEPVTSAPGAVPAVAAPAEVRVSISVSPQNAELLVDGNHVVGNPFVKTVPRSDETHRIEVRANGFSRETRTVVFDHNTDLVINLAALPKAPAQAKVPSADTTTTKPSSKSTRTIDDKDPY